MRSSWQGWQKDSRSLQNLSGRRSSGLEDGGHVKEDLVLSRVKLSLGKNEGGKGELQTKEGRRVSWDGTRTNRLLLDSSRDDGHLQAFKQAYERVSLSRALGGVEEGREERRDGHLLPPLPFLFGWVETHGLRIQRDTSTEVSQSSVLDALDVRSDSSRGVCRPAKGEGREGGVSFVPSPLLPFLS